MNLPLSSLRRDMWQTEDYAVSPFQPRMSHDVLIDKDVITVYDLPCAQGLKELRGELMPVTASRWPITNGSTSQNVFRCDMVLEMSRVAPKPEDRPHFGLEWNRDGNREAEPKHWKTWYEKQVACLRMSKTLGGEKDKWQKGWSEEVWGAEMRGIQRAT